MDSDALLVEALRRRVVDFVADQVVATFCRAVELGFFSEPEVESEPYVAALLRRGP